MDECTPLASKVLQSLSFSTAQYFNPHLQVARPSLPPGVDEDAARGFAMLTRAVDHGATAAIYYVARCFLKGHGQGR